MFWMALKVAGSAIWNFLRQVPWQVWAVLGAALAILIFGHVRYKAGYAEAESHYVAHFKKLEEQRVEATRTAQALLDDQARAIEAGRLAHEKQLLEAERRRVADLADLRRRLTIHVTAESTRTCPDVPRAYLVHRYAAAAHANGAQAPEAVGPAAEPESESSGVSLPTLAETDIAQADAFRQAVTWGEGWRDYAASTKQSCESALATITESK